MKFNEEEGRGVGKRFFLFLLISCGIVAGLPAPISAQQWYFVKWVADGDTIFLKDDRRVRFIGINAPEVTHKKSPAEPFGNAAKSALAKLVKHRRVRLEWDEVRRDRYGRHLAHVFDQKNRLLSQLMVVKGLAHVLYHKDNQRYFDVLLKSQKKAMQEKNGFWQAFQFSMQNRRFIGSKRSLRFHGMSCPKVKKIYPKNKIYFTSAWSAFEQGYAPAKGCLKGIGTFIYLEY
jgi:micrococcal nuclease